MGKWIRRIIIVIAFIMLLPNIFTLLTDLGSDIPKETREQVESGNAMIYDLDKEVQLDQDIIKFKHLVRTEDRTELIYEVLTYEPGWSFPDNALELKDEQGNTYLFNGGSSSGNSWGAIIRMDYEPIPETLDKVILDFNWYDRSFQTDIMLIEEGD
ncbi:hypothetical protein ACFSTA_04230 [Ornithinibacillus salinisoli]|uniref:DUF5643 domain-containing protein n=2 Tax=Ornithinibacillus salinisoli TaxID=1848459 RepID=A0ABW4VVC5_9BACI